MKKILIYIIIYEILFNNKFVFATNGLELIKSKVTIYNTYLVLGTSIILFITTIVQKVNLNKKARDIAKEKEKVTYLAYYDQLTRLKNRTSFYKEVEQLLSQKSKFILYFLDIDDFKSINDIYGHQEGDCFLIKIAKQLKNNFPKLEIFRLGGDEFTLVMKDNVSFESITNNAENIINTLMKPMVHNEIKASVTASIGISIYPQHGQSVGELLKNADIAMYKSKQLGKNRYFIYTDELGNEVKTFESIKDQIHIAADNLNQIHMHYQPIYDIDGQVVAVESLMRLTHLSEKMLYPNDFITLAEKTGIIHKLGLTAIEKTLIDINKYNISKTVSINISTLQLLNDEFVNEIKKLISKYNINTDKILFEIKETKKIYDINKVIVVMEKVKKLGIRIAIDDFGIGFTSIGYLYKFPIDFIKIDRSLIQEISKNQRIEQLIKDVLKLAENANIKVIAEGVENNKQLEFLIKNDCQYFQGYLKTKPFPWYDLKKIINF